MTRAEFDALQVGDHLLLKRRRWPYKIIKVITYRDRPALDMEGLIEDADVRYSGLVRVVCQSEFLRYWEPYTIPESGWLNDPRVSC